MDGVAYRKKINKLKKLAAKGESGLFIATCLLFLYVFFHAVWRRFKTPIWRTAVSMAVVLVFFSNTSFQVESHSDGYTYDELYNGYFKDEELASEVNAVVGVGEEEQWTKVSNEDDMAKLDDMDDIAASTDTMDMALTENTGELPAAAEPSAGTFDKNDWNLILVNKTHSVPEDYTFTLATIKGNMKCDERILTPLKDMFKAAAADGITLIVCSPYRDISLQEKLFDRKMKMYIEAGYSYIDAYREASSVVTVPGTSEHQLGLALDIVSSTYSLLNAGFGDTAAGKWLMDNAHEYGFIMRYPRDKEEITGIIYEPWHYRYVGIEAACFMHERGICLEEFIESI